MVNKSRNQYSACKTEYSQHVLNYRKTYFTSQFTSRKLYKNTEVAFKWKLTKYFLSIEAVGTPENSPQRERNARRKMLLNKKQEMRNVVELIF